MVHTRTSARKLGITLEQLHGVVQCLREGGVSSSSSNTFCPNPPPYDTKIVIFSGSSEDNPLNLHGTRYGRKTSGSGLVQDTEPEPSTDVLLEISPTYEKIVKYVQNQSADDSSADQAEEEEDYDEEEDNDYEPAAEYDDNDEEDDELEYCSDEEDDDSDDDED